MEELCHVQSANRGDAQSCTVVLAVLRVLGVFGRSMYSRKGVFKHKGKLKCCKKHYKTMYIACNNVQYCQYFTVHGRNGGITGVCTYYWISMYSPCTLSMYTYYDTFVHWLSRAMGSDGIHIRTPKGKIYKPHLAELAVSAEPYGGLPRAKSINILRI